MFEAAELGASLSKEEHAAVVPRLRTDLLAMQRALQDADFPVLVLLNGVDGAGRRESANLLSEWLDARYLATHAFSEATEEERQHPEFWRYWMALPPRGRVGVYIGNWYTDPIVERAEGRGDDARLMRQLRAIRDFERTLADDGALIIKLWFHLSKDHQKKRLKRLQKDSRTRWRVTDAEQARFDRYEEYRSVSAAVIADTSTGACPWTIIEGSDDRHREVAVGRTLLAAVQARLERPPTPPRAVHAPTDATSLLARVDLSKTIAKSDYKKRLEELQGRLHRLSRKVEKKDRSCILVFQGWDAAGKGGAIRRVIQALDADRYRVIPVSAPTDEEAAHHYLWRFWRHLPRRGRFTIFDRSWYGRVLVERVEGFAKPDEWRRAYAEINEFEQQLVEDGAVLVKFWLHISQEEQLRRFKDREQTPYKSHKITEEDYRNREKWPLYEAAVGEMIARTGTDLAPWTLVAAESKHHARLEVLETICDRLNDAL